VIGGLGEILAARPRGISSTGAIACDGGFDQDGDGERDITRAFLFHNGTLSTVAETGGTFEGNPETDVRAVGVDSANRVIYTMTFESGEEELISLRAWEAGQTSFIAHEGLDFGQDADGMDQRILELEQVRVSQGGDVLFVVTLGRFEQGTRRITGTRLMRWNGGALETVLQTDAQVSGGRLVGFSIADVNDVGDVLLIGEIDRRANRALLLLPR
jgi:hypothetical protein